MSLQVNISLRQQGKREDRQSAGCLLALTVFAMGNLLGASSLGVEIEDRTQASKWLDNMTPIQWITLDGDYTLSRISRYVSLRPDLTHERVDPERILNLEDMALLLRLSQFLLDEQNKLRDRKNAAAALGWLQHRHSIPPLLAIMRDANQDAELRGDCAKALGYILDRCVVGFLIQDGLTAEENAVVGGANLALARLVVGPDPPRWPPPPPGQMFDRNISEAEHQRHIRRWQQWWEKNQLRIKLGRNMVVQ